MKNFSTSRLLIRSFASSDLDDFLSYQSHPVVRRHMRGNAMSAELAAQFLARQAELVGDEPEMYHCKAVYHVADGRVIGDVGMFLQTDARFSADLGFHFHPSYHGKGYAYESVSVFLNHLLAEMELSRVTAGCRRENLGSWRLLERLGLRRIEETLQGYAYEIRREEWLAKPSPQD